MNLETKLHMVEMITGWRPRKSPLVLMYAFFGLWALIGSAWFVVCFILAVANSWSG